MEFYISENGKAYFLNYTQKTNSVLDVAAAEAVKKTDFQPAFKDNHKVNSTKEIPVTFHNLGVIN